MMLRNKEIKGKRGTGLEDIRAASLEGRPGAWRNAKAARPGRLDALTVNYYIWCDQKHRSKQQFGTHQAIKPSRSDSSFLKNGQMTTKKQSQQLLSPST